MSNEEPEPKCGSKETHDGTPCENAATSCPWHEPVDVETRAARNEQNIEHLISIVERLGENVDHAVNKIGEIGADGDHDAEAGEEYSPVEYTDPGAMYQ